MIEDRSALSGIRVLELGRSLAGRLLVKLLTDQGAEASAVRLAGLPVGGGPEADFDDGLEPLDFDLDDLADQERFVELVGEADVFIRALPAEATTRLTPILEHAGNRGLVTVSFVAYPTEADRPDAALDDALIVAELGLDHAGYVYGQPPRETDVPAVEPLAIPSSYAAGFAATYLATALLHRERRGQGALIEISLFGAGIMALNAALASVSDTRLRNERVFPSFRLPILDRYRCADGSFFQLQGNTATTLVGTLEGLGHPEWYPEAVKGLGFLGSAEELALWRDRFSAVLATATAAEWEERIAARRGAGTRCRTRSEWAIEPQARANGILAEEELSGGSSLRVGPAVQLFADPSITPAADGPRPLGGADLEAPLAGLRVLDLTLILAGPTIGRLLSELGADVIKVDPADRAVWPGVAPMIWLDTNRGKRSTIVDLRTEAGREVLWRLIEEADVFVENFRLGRLAALGFSYEELARRNPRLVYLSANAFGFDGPFAERPGWEPNAQAMTGMQAARSGPDEMRYLASPINDYGTAVLGTYGLLLALREARATGVGRRVTVSLARTATFFQQREFAWSAPLRARDDMDSAAFPRCRDGWIFVENGAVATEELAALVGALSRREAVELLEQKGWAAAVVRSPRELAELSWVRESGLLVEFDHPVWGPTTHVVAQARAGDLVRRPTTAAPVPGGHTREVLVELGYAADEIEALYGSGAVAGPLSLLGD